MEAWPLPTLQVPDIVRQKGATSFMGSSSQRSLASLLPPKLMIKLRSENTPFPATKPDTWRQGPRKEELVEREVRMAREGGKLMGPLWP